MLILIISVVALLVFLFSMDMSWSNVVSDNRNNLVFEDRFTDYGAYAIRREHHVNVFYALVLSVGLIGGGFMAISAMRSKPVQKYGGNPLDDYSIVCGLPPIAEKKEDLPEEKRTKTTATVKPAGANNNEYVVTDEDLTKKISSDLDQSGKQLGGDGGEETGEIQKPFDPNPSGNGSSGGLLPKKKEARRFVKNPPEYPGGVSEMMRYMGDQVRYSERDIEANVEGIIYISFVVNEDGSVRDVVIERGIHNGDRLAKRAMEAINRMPRWKPGDDGAEPVPVVMTMPLKFELRK